MTTLKDILPLKDNRVLVISLGKPSLKRIYRTREGGLTCHTSAIHGNAATHLKQRGYVFLHESAWPWDADGNLTGRNPSKPQIKWADGSYVES